MSSDRAAPAAGSSVPVHVVLGTGRCGSTLVHEILARHPDVGFLSNLEDRLPLPPSAGRWNNELYRRIPPDRTRKGGARFAPSEGYRALEREVHPMLANPVRDLTASDATPWMVDRFRRFFDRRSAAQHRPAFLHKFTGWPRAGFVSVAYPDARYAVVVRDGRAVANSWLQMPWWKGHLGPDAWGWGPLPDADREAWERSGRSFPVLAAICWKLLVEAHHDAAAKLPSDRWLEVRYEDLLAAPSVELDAMLRHFGLPSSPVFATQLSQYRFSTGRKEAFRTDLAASDVADMEAVIGPLLERYRYV